MLDLAAVKNELDITYDDNQLDDKIAGILNRAEGHVRDVCAISAEAELSLTEEQLVLDCCRYIYNAAFEDFDANFIGIINGCRASRQVADMEDDENVG